MIAILRRHYSLFAFTVAVVLFGTLGYHLIERMSLLDAFYMTYITISTVGFHEVNPLSVPGQLFTVVLITVGLGLLFLAATTLGQELVAAANRRRSMRMENQIAALSGHHVLCGYGRMGRVIAQHLSRAGSPFVVVDSDESIITALREEGAMALHGDATNDDVMERAGVRNARGLVSVLSTDAENVFVTLTARELNPQLFILTRANNEDAISKLYRAGASKVINPYESAGARMAHTLLRPVVGDFMEVFSTESGVQISLEEVRVMAGSRLAGRTLRESDVRRLTNAVIVAVKKQGTAKLRINPPGDEVMEAGDLLVAIADSESLATLAELARA